MRQSITAHRISHPIGSQVSSATAAAKLAEKRKEYDAVSALEKTSALVLERIEGIAEDCDIMAVAGEVHGQVLDQWPKMFQILHLFLASREQAGENFSELPAFHGQRLVRVPIEELQEQLVDKQT